MSGKIKILSITYKYYNADTLKTTLITFSRISDVERRYKTRASHGQFDYEFSHTTKPTQAHARRLVEHSNNEKE